MKDNGKVFAGPRLKRFRRDNDLTQAEMATELGISASYLNLMEHNQRPVTATILLKLATVFDVNLARFESAEEEQLLADLEAVFTDPLVGQPNGPSRPQANGHGASGMGGSLCQNSSGI